MTYHHFCRLGQAVIAAILVGATLVTGGSSTLASQPMRVTSVHLYYIAVGDGGRSGVKIGCGDSLVAVTRSIRPTTAPLTAALKLLLADHHKYYGQSGLFNSLYRSRLTLRSATVKNRTANVRLSGTTSLGGECDNPRAIAQLRYTVLQFKNIHRATITINGVPVSRRFSGKG